MDSAAKAAAAEAAAAEPAGAAATAVVDNVGNAVPPVVSEAALSAYTALYVKAKAKAEEEEEEEEEREEEEDKEVVKEEEDIGSRGKEDKVARSTALWSDSDRTMWSTVARNLQLQRGGRMGPIVTCPSPDRTDNPNPADPNPAAPSPLGAINKASERLGHSFLTHLTTATATTTTTTSAANPATTTTATGNNNSNNNNSSSSNNPPPSNQS
ncbi:hypothetical protein P8C59_009627 [Phyllachora maydis]|uniref:Uncharacterized protein n=1 Tax=Phyllachora maydis TaxID=1825666 RepID=A0AAD9IEE9_9PEZI|nr:hypothetical protein P8C59_009627 [Phyllachora maydis]